ncbi:Fe-S cluster assembly protein SufD [Cognatiluteimonas profundi]|uniref:Fe-S cluster assembly protein SufD n=1 Tax=Cognatiluteimonas profundi TaxID=2594501 RepID=UPI00131CA280|nr:Fe-S cluster assembly protein SufD [Lysobacter profundi]
MSALLDSLAASFRGNATQRSVLDAALRDGLPGARNEAWKYTSLRSLERRSFVATGPEASEFDAALLADIPAPRLVFVNGRFDARHSDCAELPAGVVLRPLSDGPTANDDAIDTDLRAPRREAAVFERLATALADEGVVLQVAAGIRTTTPLHLVFVGIAAAADVASHARHLVDVGAGASVAVVEHQLHGGDHANLSNALMHVRLAAGAELLHARVQDECVRATVIAQTMVVLAASARYQRIDMELGAGLSRHDIGISLDGDDARASANGILLGTGRRHLDTRLGVEHRGRDTSCDLVWRGLGAGRSRTVFRGGIVIHAGADGADARLANKNILLGEGAEIDTQPALEIHADEVKAAHGATVGRLDPTALFYLRSRGLPEPDARRLLTGAFCREITEGVSDPTVRDVLTRSLERALATLEIG